MRLKSPARRRECVVACRLGGVAKRETRGGGRCGSSEIPTHHRVRSLCEGPSGFVPVDGIRDIRRPFFRHRGGKRAGLFHVDSGALDTARRRRSFAELVMCKSIRSSAVCAVCAPGRTGFLASSLRSSLRSDELSRVFAHYCSREPDVFLAARRCDAPGTRTRVSPPAARRAREPIDSRV